MEGLNGKSFSSGVLTDHLDQVFGLGSSSEMAKMAKRLREVVGGSDLTKFSLAKLAQAVGHEDVSKLDSYLSGEEPLPFPTAYRPCELLNLSPDWLLDGIGTPFFQEPRFKGYGAPNECWRFLIANKIKCKDGSPYTFWYFVLSDEADGRASIFGYSDSAPWRVDLLLTNIPIGENLGGTGMQQFFAFSIMCAAIDPSLTRPTLVRADFHTLGRAIQPDFYKRLTRGNIHSYEFNRLRNGESGPLLHQCYSYNQQVHQAREFTTPSR